MDKYGEMGDSLYCYPGTNILKNKLNIHDEQILEQAELELSGLASNLIEYAEPPYDLQYLKSIHAQLFGDLEVVPHVWTTKSLFISDTLL